MRKMKQNAFTGNNNDFYSQLKKALPMPNPLTSLFHFLWNPELN